MKTPLDAPQSWIDAVLERGSVKPFLDLLDKSGLDTKTILAVLYIYCNRAWLIELRDVMAVARRDVDSKIRRLKELRAEIEASEANKERIQALKFWGLRVPTKGNILQALAKYERHLLAFRIFYRRWIKLRKTPIVFLTPLRRSVKVATGTSHTKDLQELLIAGFNASSGRAEDITDRAFLKRLQRDSLGIPKTDSLRYFKFPAEDISSHQKK